MKKKYIKKIKLLREFLYKKKILYPTSGIIFLSYDLKYKDIDYIIDSIKKVLLIFLNKNEKNKNFGFNNFK